MKPLMVDLFAGLGGWAEGGLAEGYDVIGFDIEQHVYGEHRYPAQLVVQDVTTLHGSQFRNAALIVASPPCQAYSYMAMPWTLAKAKAAAIRADTTGQALTDLNRLFDVCFRIQKEASIAAGRHIPCIIENVRGAIPWVGRARWNHASYYLWGDVPALMPVTVRLAKIPGQNWSRFNETGAVSPHWNMQSIKNNGTKQGGDWFAEARKGGVGGTSASFGSKSPQRKMASAMIAKIPLPLSRHVAATYFPRNA